MDYTLRISDDLFRGDNQVSNPTDAQTIFHRYSLTGAYRISDQFMVQATVPFLNGSFEEDGIDDDTISGLADISFLGSWRPSQVPGLSLNLGFITPTGTDREQPIVGIVTPSVFQLGTGTWQILLGAGYARQVGDWFFSTQFDVSLPLETSSQGFKAAESYFLTLGANHILSDSFRVGFAVQGSYTTEDEFLGIDLTNTGAATISLRPSVIWKITDRLSMSGSVTVPVYRDLNETGIAAGPTWRLGFSSSF